MPVDLASLDGEALQNFIDSHRRNNATGEKIYGDAIAELAKRKDKGLDLDTTMRAVQDAANMGRFISYGEVAAASGAKWSVVRHAIGPHLDSLIEYCHLNGLPPLSAIVVNKTNLVTGELDPDSLKGFIAGVRGVGIPVHDEHAFLRESQRAVFEWARAIADTLPEHQPSKQSGKSSIMRPLASVGTIAENKESSAAGGIRAFLTRHYVQPARAKGDREITIRAGEVHKNIGFINRMPAVCSALDGELFREENCLELIDRSGPPQGATATFRFQLNGRQTATPSDPRTDRTLAGSPQEQKISRVQGGDKMSSHSLSAAERAFCSAIRRKDTALRSFLDSNRLPNTTDAMQWLRYLTGIKHALGNFNSDLGFVATLLAADYLQRRFGIGDFDAAGKRQSAAGADVQAKTPDGKLIIAEIKTITPYQSGFGAAQRTAILKDLARLAASSAEYRFIFVVDPDAYRSLCDRAFATKAPGVELVDLVSGESCFLGASAQPKPISPAVS